MKKIIALALSTILLLSSTACSAKSSTPSTAAITNDTAPAASASTVSWPTEDVTVYVASSAGGGTDLAARIVAQYFSKYTGYNMIVENQTSGSGTVAYESVRNAKPDGNTLLYYHSSLFISQYSGIYDHNILESFTPVERACESLGNAICVPASSPYNTLDELIAAAKAAPDSIIAGIQVGGFPEYLIKLLEKAGDCKFRSIDAGNATDRLTSLLGGHIDVACISVSGAKPYYDSGDLKVLAVTSSERSDLYPDWPSVAELGYPSVVIPNDHIFYGPANMAPALVDAMIDVFVQIGADPDFQEAIRGNGNIPAVCDNAADVTAAAKAADEAVQLVFSLL